MTDDEKSAMNAIAARCERLAAMHEKSAKLQREMAEQMRTCARFGVVPAEVLKFKYNPALDPRRELLNTLFGQSFAIQFGWAKSDSSTKYDAVMVPEWNVCVTKDGRTIEVRNDRTAWDEFLKERCQTNPPITGGEFARQWRAKQSGGSEAATVAADQPPVAPEGSGQ